MDDTRRYLALIITVLTFIFLSALLWLSRDQKEIIFAMLTGTLSILNALVNFYFGSSEGSQKKTGIIKDLTEKTECNEEIAIVAQKKRVAVEAVNQERKEAVEAENQEQKEAVEADNQERKEARENL